MNMTVKSRWLMNMTRRSNASGEILGEKPLIAKVAENMLDCGIQH